MAKSFDRLTIQGEYPASSTSASEAANQHALSSRGPVFILVTNLPLSFGTPLAVSIFLVVFSACKQAHYSTVWRVCFGIGCLLPLSIFYFRIKMLNSVLYRRGAIKRSVPYRLVLRYYWRSLIGTCGAWFLYDFVVRLAFRSNFLLNLGLGSLSFSKGFHDCSMLTLIEFR